MFLKLIFLVSFVFADEVHFSKKTLEINKVKITVEIADTERKQAQGLMNRTKMKDDEGMLFIFKSEEPRSFWMKNTFIPLSIGFFNKNKKLLEIIDMKPVVSAMEIHPPSYQSQFPAQYALEVNKGWFEKHKIKVGDTFKLR